MKHPYLLLCMLLLCTMTISAQRFSYTGQSIPKPKIGHTNGHKWVDLGLSVKWATCNVGAKTPTEYGEYYAWGETCPKEEYNEESYTYPRDPRRLDAAHDAATVNWGAPWRMPTIREMEELLDYCTWEKVKMGDVVGYKITSKKPGYKNASIFLPKSGYRSDYTRLSAGSDGHYWSSNLEWRVGTMAHGIGLMEGMVGLHLLGRYPGRSVRAVCP